MKISSLLLAMTLSFASFSALAEIVNLNKASAAALQHYLKGVGEKKAADIVKYRTEHKTFKSIEEVMEVKGIGEGIFKKIKTDLSLTKGVTSTPAKKAKAASTTKNATPKTEAKTKNPAKAS
jgi:competence protein ComEA